MECNISQYSKKDFSSISGLLSFFDRDQAVELLTRKYGKNQTEAIINAFDNGTFNKDWEMNAPTTESSSEPTQLNINGAKNSSVEVDNLLSFYMERENLKEARDNMVKKFFDEVISRTIYDKRLHLYKSVIDDNSINKALYEYKKSLLIQLGLRVGKSRADIEDELKNNELTVVITKTLNSFIAKYNNSTNATSMYDWDAYVILKNFNDLLRKYVPFIKLDSAFKNSKQHAKFMYRYDPNGTYRDNWTDSEDSDISKTTSELVKQLAEFFETKEGIPIGFTMFTTVMSTVAVWVRENSYLDTDIKAIAQDLRIHGLNANFDKMIKTYIEKTNPNRGMVNILDAIRENIFAPISNLPSSIKQAFANQFFQTAKYSYFAYRLDWQDKYKLKGQYLEDSFIEVKTASLDRTIRNRVYFLAQDPDLFEKFLAEKGITITKQTDTDDKKNVSAWTISFSEKVYGVKNFTITIKKRLSNNQLKANSIDVDFSVKNPVDLKQESWINLIEELLYESIPENYTDILQAMSVNALEPATMFGAFREVIAVILGGTQDLIYAKQENLIKPAIFELDEETKMIKTYSYSGSFFKEAGRFISIRDGVNMLNVIKNGEGNNLPIYQLSPAMYDIFDLIDELVSFGNSNSTSSITPQDVTGSREYEQYITKNTISENPILTNRGLLKKVIVRSDVKVGNVVKSADKLTPKELLHLAIVNDFYQLLTGVEDEESENIDRSIALQPIVYSDKKTHFLGLFDLAVQYLNVGETKETLHEILRKIANPKENSTKEVKALTEEIKRVRYDENMKVVRNQLARFLAVFSNKRNFDGVSAKTEAGELVSGDALIAKLGISTVVNDDGISIISDKKINDAKRNLILPIEPGKFNPKAALDFISGLLNQLNQFEKPLELLQTLFGKQNAVLYGEDVASVGGKLQINETLYFNALVYGNDEHLKWYIETQKRLFAIDMQEADFELDTFLNPELRRFVGLFGESKEDRAEISKWYDPYSGIIRKARFFQKQADGKLMEIYPTQDKIESVDFENDDNITVELNPILEGYFYANMYLGHSLNEIEFGSTAGYEAKKVYKIDFTNTNERELLKSIIPFTASRLSNEFKRTTIGGAVKRKFTPGLKYGASAKIITATIEDLTSPTSTIRGDFETVKTQDGLGITAPTLHRMQNKSLVDHPLGEIKKTIAGWNDPTSNMQEHFKWAENVITAELRQRTQGDGSIEVVYRKMYSQEDITRRFNSIAPRINFKKYYNPNAKEDGIYKEGDHVITRTDYIYQYDLDEGVYWRLESIEYNNRTGRLESSWTTEDGKTKLIRRQVQTLYDIDQVLGGAFVFEIAEDGSYVSSEGVHDILYNLICNENFKEAFVGYLVTRSAAKAGVNNVNSRDVLKDDNTKLKTFYIPSVSVGAQMNADHDMDLSSVTEMSQMIALLSQGGKNMDIVNQMYEDIGKVASEAMSELQTALNTNDDAKLYRVLGKALIDTFDSREKQEISLAQSFIRNAQNAILKEKDLKNVILPYSSESIKGSFITTVGALINKKGIKRKYAGFGAVQAGSDNIMQIYSFNGRTYNYVKFRDAIRPILKERGLTWQDVQYYPGRKPSDYLMQNDNPFFKRIKREDVKFEDTITISRIIGDQLVHETFTIKTLGDLDYVRNLSQGQVHIWTTAPRELSASDVRYKTDDGRSFSECDVDSVRATEYLRQLLSYKSGKNEDWNKSKDVKLQVLRAVFGDSIKIPSPRNKGGSIELVNINNIESTPKEMILSLMRLAAKKTQDFFDQISYGLKEGAVTVTTPLALDSTRSEIKITSYSNLKAQVVIGRKNFEKYLLKKGDRLSDVEDYHFFEKRLMEKENSMNNAVIGIDQSIYDGTIQFGNGDTALVLVGDISTVSHLYGANQDFFVSDNAVSYKGKVIFSDSKLKGVCDLKDLNFFTYINEDNGVSIPVIHLPNWDAFDRIKRSNVVINHSINYNSNNIIDLLRQRYKDNFDENGNVKTPFDITLENLETGNLDLIAHVDNNFIKNIAPTRINVLRYALEGERETDIIPARITKKAKLMYAAFKTQLHYIETRIPSQHMQSTMTVEVVDFIDSDKNYIYIPRALMYLQGSDLDIDKDYCMGYDVDDNGLVYTMSDLTPRMPSFLTEDDLRSLPDQESVEYKNISEYTPEELELLKTDPNYVIVTLGEDELVNLIKGDRQESIKHLLSYGRFGKTIIFNPNVTWNIKIKNSEVNYYQKQIDALINDTIKVHNAILRSLTYDDILSLSDPDNTMSFESLWNYKNPDVKLAEIKEKADYKIVYLTLQEINNLVKTKRINAIKTLLRNYGESGKTIVFTYNPINFTNDRERTDFNKKLLLLNSIIKDLKTHSQSAPRSNFEKEASLRNKIASAAMKIMDSPSSRINAATPIAMVEPRAAAELNESLSNKDKRLNLDNPVTIFNMQKQYMAGKEVTAMTATGIKSYFISTTYVNTMIDQIDELLDEYVLEKDLEKRRRIGDDIVRLFGEIVFDAKLSNEVKIATFANVNFYRLREKLSKNPDLLYTIQCNSSTMRSIVSASEKFKTYEKVGRFNLFDLVEDLNFSSNGQKWILDTSIVEALLTRIRAIRPTYTYDLLLSELETESGYNNLKTRYADDPEILKLINSTWTYFTINAPDSLSALLSAATDNAKELLLDKLNATSKFADIYITLLAQGVPFKDIARIMTNPAFKIVAKYSQDLIFDPNTQWFNVEKALSFVLNDSQLDTIGKDIFENYIIDSFQENSAKQHEGFLFDVLDKKVHHWDKNKGNYEPEIKTVADILWPILVEHAIKSDKTGNIKTEDDFYRDVTSKEANASVFGIKIPKSSTEKIKNFQASIGNSELKRWFAKQVLSMFNDNKSTIEYGRNNLILSEFLLSHLIVTLKKGIDSYSNASTNARSYISEDSEDYIDFVLSMLEDSNFDENVSTSDTGFKNNMNKSLRKNDLINIYRYVVKYFKPKTELWNALPDAIKDRANKDFANLRDKVLFAIKEYKIIGKIGSINQGVPVKDFDEYKFVSDIEKFINKAYIEQGEKRAPKMQFEEFDLIRYLTDTKPEFDEDGNEKPSYHDRQIAQYNLVKASVNVLKAIDNTANFKAMFSFIKVNRNIDEKAIAAKLERKIIKSLLTKVRPKSNNGINRGLTSQAYQEEFKIASQYVRDLLAFNFFVNGPSLTFKVPIGVKYYGEKDITNRYKLSVNKEKGNTLTLNTLPNLASFKHIVDYYVIPALKAEFRSNAFIKSLQQDTFKDPKSKELIDFFKINVPIITKDSSKKAIDKYNRVLSDFNKILYKKVPLDIGNWTIGNLFYVYNLIVNRGDRIGGNSMSMLFEDLVSSGSAFSVAWEYNKFLSSLDKRETNIFDENGNIDTSKFIFDIRDLQYRLSGTNGASWKYGVKERLEPGKRAVISVESANDRSDFVARTVPNDRAFISDFILYFPFLTDFAPTQQVKEDYLDTVSYTASNETVFNVVLEELSKKYGKDIPIRTIREKEIDKESAFNNMTDEEKSKLKENSGFIYDGVVYINLDKADLSTPMHEIMHLIAAAMKFSTDSTVRDAYYRLLDYVTEQVQINSKLKVNIDEMKKAYPNRHLSDLKEEILVRVLANEFANNFTTEWGEKRTMDRQFLQATVKKVLFDVLNVDDNEDILFSDFNNTSFRSIVRRYVDHYLWADDTLTAIVIEQNREIANLKDALIKGGFVELSKDCI